MIKWTNKRDRQQKREDYNTKGDKRSDFQITSSRSCAGRIHANKSDDREHENICPH
jgi:hypothetical protein